MWFKSIFGGDDSTENQEHNEEKAFEQKIQDAIRRCQADKAATEAEVKKMLASAEDVIMDIYADFFENAKLSYYRNQHRVGLLDRYPQVKKEHSAKLPPEMVSQCDRIVNGYINNALTLQTKVQVFDKMLAKYKESLERLKSAKERIADLKTMGKHEDNLKKMGDDTSHTANMLKSEYEMEELTREFENKEEYYKQLEILQQQYGDDQYFDRALDHKAQLDKMMGEI